MNEDTAVWHDYDGDPLMRRMSVAHPDAAAGLFELAVASRAGELCSDLEVSFDWDPQSGHWIMTPTEQAAHEPGIGKVDYVCRNAQEEIVPCGSEGASEPEPMLSHYHGDQIGSTRAITGPGSAGVPPASIQGRIVYTACGERVGSDGAVSTRYQYAGSWGYQSELYEDASGNLPFVHVGHRWYDPSTGRFLQRDPIGVSGGLNVYEYVWGRPTSLVDPLGLWTFGFEFELSVNFGCVGFKFSYGIHGGYSRKRGFSGACHGSASANAGPGKGFSVGPEVVITTADSAHDLAGTTDEINLNLGVANFEGLLGTTGGWDGEPTRPYYGFSAGLGIGSNYGVNAGRTFTAPGSGNSYPIRGPGPGL